MSGNHKRKNRNMWREWRYKSVVHLFVLLWGLKLHRKDYPRYGDPRWDYVRRFEGKHRGRR